MKQLTVLSGAGISAESGLKTFRDGDGYWRQYRFEEVASPEAWVSNPDAVLDFYNERRRQLADVSPNKAHHTLVDLEKYYDVRVITQNVDDLHERAGSANIIHLHGELTKARSSMDSSIIVEIGYKDILSGEKAKDGAALRPHIVWFGEDVPLFPASIDVISRSDILLIVGTSLTVYPAATLIHYCHKGIPVIYIDPDAKAQPGINLEIFPYMAEEGMKLLLPRLIELSR